MPIVDGHYVSEEELPLYESINNQTDVIKEDDGLSCLKWRTSSEVPAVPA